MANNRGNILLDVNIEFTYSSTLELVSSLHVITNPTHHTNCVDWHDKILAILDGELLNKIVDFGNRYAEWSYVMDIVDFLIVPRELTDHPIDDFTEIIDGIIKMPQGNFAYIFLGETLLGDIALSENILSTSDVFDNYRPDELRKYLKWKDAQYFIRHVETIRSEMIEIMTRYHDKFFRHHWVETCSFYKNALINERKIFESTTISNYILSLHDDLSYENNALIIKKETLFEIKKEAISSIKIIFSTYTFPHLMMNIYGNTLSLYENLLIPNMSTTFDHIANSARVFGDSTRLAIIKLLLKSEATTKTLAKLLNITPASVSQHLKILKDAGILSFHRDKNNVLYTVNKDGILQTIKTITSFLEL